MNDSSPRFSDSRWDPAIGGAALVALPLCAFSPVLMGLVTAASYGALVVCLARADRFRGQRRPGDPGWAGVGSKINGGLRLLVLSHAVTFGLLSWMTTRL